MIKGKRKEKMVEKKNLMFTNSLTHLCLHMKCAHTSSCFHYLCSNALVWMYSMVVYP
jgi:hypothetical protein